jgi:16S rRNA (cytosine967-C5)-methyltransferase
MIAPARVAAYEVLRAVSSGTADLPHALARVRPRLPDERDRALAGEIATGTLRWRAACDHLVVAISGRPLARLDGEVLDILRAAIFQLLHLDRVPAAAVVNDAVSLTRAAGKRSAAPLVNAVLRRISRERGRLPLPARPETPADREQALDYLAITLSHPRWLAARWMDRHGFDAAEAWMRFNNAPAPLTLRVNGLKIAKADLIERLAQHGVVVTPARFAPNALVVNEGNPLLTPIAGDGLFFVQDEASQLVAAMVNAVPGERVLDACASPGGKTTAIAEGAGDRALIVAADVRGARIDLLAKTVRRSGTHSVRIVHADATALPFPSAQTFDWVLLDAPCSGLGTIRRDPDVRWRRTDADLPGLADMQLHLIREAARVLKPGGRLVYATCSSEPEENEFVVARFLEEGAFSRDPGAPSDAVRPFIDGHGYLRTFPFAHGLEAFFAVRLLKQA